MVLAESLVQYAFMAQRTRHFLRAWRKSKELSLAHVAERVELLSQEHADADPDVRPISMTHATLSRIERHKLPYNQYLIELLAEIYGTDEASLIMRDPSQPEAPYSLLESLTPAQKIQAIEIIKAIKRTGTAG